MRKVLNFVKGKKDDKRAFGHPLASPFLEEFQVTCQPERTERTWPNEDSSTSIENGWGYNIDFSGKDKSITKLHKAAWQGNLEKLKVNIKKGDIDAADQYNRTPLHLAVARGNSNIVWYLLNTKAKLNICDSEGRTPFLKAVECGHKDIIVMMLERGVDLNTIDYSGNSALHIAAKQGYYEITSILLKEGANFESSNNLGESPLHIATQAQHRDLIELLLRYGSSVNAVDRDNRSPLMFAAKNGNMAIVQLFLEYGAQRKVQDSNDWTAEDYAILGGHHDVAAELKSPSEIVALDFNAKLVDSTDRTTTCSTFKRSISVESLPRGDGDKKSKMKNEEADSDTWNDSQLSEAAAKPQTSGLKLTKFLPPSSDEDVSEESESSNKIDELKEEEMQDSPRSCVIPPPCKPPRSWDLIQSGVIDDPNGSEPKRRSLLTLGSLRSKRESFTESPSGTDSPSQQGASPHKNQGDVPSLVRSNDRDISPVQHSKSMKSDSIDRSERNKFSTLSKDKLSADKSENLKENSDSDWDSDDSLPLDSFNAKGEAPPVPPLPVEILEQVDSSLAQGSKDTLSESSSIEKRGRFLLRATSIDLTDDDGEMSKERNMNLISNSESEKNSMMLEVGAQSSASGTFGREGTLMGYEEVWEANPQVLVHPSGPSSINESCNLIPEVETESSGKILNNDSKRAIVESWGGIVPPNSKRVIEDNLVYPSPCLEQKNKQVSLGSFEVGEVKPIKYKRESHSLDELGHVVHFPSQNVVDTTVIHKKKHSRQQSISVLNWSKSEDLYQRPRSTNLERMIADSKRINKQLECYDEALRELAKVSLVKKQHSLPDPPRPDGMDPPVSRYIGAKAQRYLSLPRTNELIDEAFKEIGQSSANMKRTSLSLPRTITPKDMEAAGESIVKRRKPRRRAESEGETFSTRLEDHINRSLSFDTKLQGASNSSLPKTPAPMSKNISGSAKSAQIITSAQLERGPNADKPIRKKRKILLAMRCFRKYERESVNGTSPTEASEEESSEDPPFWLSTDKSGALERQSTVIEKVDFRPKTKSEPFSVSPSDSSYSSHTKDIEFQIEEEQSEVKDVIVEFHEEGSNVTVKEETVCSLEQIHHKTHDVSAESCQQGEELKTHNEPVKPKKIEQVLVQITACSDNELEDETMNSINDDFKVEKVEDGGKEIKSNPETEKLTDSENVPQRLVNTEEIGSEDAAIQPDVVSTEAKDSTIENVWDVMSPGHLTPLSSKEGESHGDLFGDSVSTSHPSSTSVDHEEQRVLDFHKDSQSEGDSGGSQNDITPQHQLSLKHSHNLLKEHLRTATAERGRLQETAAQLGEQAEKLKYELADAKEAAQSREEVIALLQGQLSDMESKYGKVLEETHHYRLRLGNVEQELRHLHEVCSKYEEEKMQLLELIQQKDLELNELSKKITDSEGDRKSSMAMSEKDIEKVQQEYMIQMIYLEEENHKISEELGKLEKKNNELQIALEDITAQNEFLTEENNRIFTQTSLEIKALEDEATRWKDLFESGVKKLSEQMALSVPCVVKVATSFGAEVELLKLVDKYKHELNEIVGKFQDVRDKINNSLCQESLNGHPDFQEEISQAIQVLKRGYQEIEAALNEHDRTLQKLTEKFEKTYPVDHSGFDEVSKMKHSDLNVQEQSQVLLCQLKQFQDTDDIVIKSKFVKEMECFLENIIDILQNVNAESKSIHLQVENWSEKSPSQILYSKRSGFTMQRRYSEESGVTAYKHSMAMIDQLMKENKLLKDQLEEVKCQQDVTTLMAERQYALDSVLEKNKCLSDSVASITKLYEETVKIVDKYKEENEKLKFEISILERKLKDMDCMDIVERLNQENKEYKLKNDILEQELDSYRISKLSKSSQTCDEEIAEIINENESIKTELECAKKQLSYLETELSRIAQVKDFHLFLKNEESSKTAEHNPNVVDEYCVMRNVEKVLGSQSIVSNAFKGFSQVISQLCQENQTLKTQLQVQKNDSDIHFLPPQQDATLISMEVDQSNNQTRASMYCSRSLDSEDENGCENLAASVTSDSCEDVDERGDKKMCDSEHCDVKSRKGKRCSSTSENAASPNCVPQCSDIPEPINQDVNVEYDRELSSPPTKDDADIVPLSLQYLIDPRNRETEFTCKNTAAHPKEYSHKNGKLSTENSGCQGCHNSLKLNEKSASKDIERSTRKSPRTSEDSETAVWNCSVVNGCDKRRVSEKSRKFLRDRCLTTGSIDDHITSYKHDGPSDVRFFLVDGEYKGKTFNDELYSEVKEKFCSKFGSKEAPTKSLAAFTDLSNFQSSFRTYPDYVHGCATELFDGTGDIVEPCSKTCTWPCRDAATNTNSAQTSLELQRELIQEREKSRRNQQSMKKLKAEVQVLRNKLGDVKKNGKMESSNYASTSNSCCSVGNSRHVHLSSAPVSPLRFDQTLAEFQRKVVDLEQKLREENSMRWALELQVNKMKYELKEKMQLEKDLDSLRCQMEKEFVSRYELEQLKRNYEIALQRAKQDAESAVRDDVSSRLHQINTVIEKQMQEQSRYEQIRNSSEAQIRQDFKDTRLKLLSELARVQNALQEKGEKELELRQKCEKLSQECEKKHDLRRKKLIEKSYSINLAPYSSLGKEKDYVPKVGVVHHRSLPSHIPAQHSISVPAKIPDNWPGRVPMNHFLRRELEKSIRKHSGPDVGAEQVAASTSHSSADERLKILKNKYFLH